MKLVTLTSAMVLLLGCGGDEEGGQPIPVDAGNAIDGVDAMVEGPPACTGLLPNYDLTGVSFTGYARPRDTGDPTSPTVYGLTTILDQGPPIDLFEIQLWSGFGAFSEEVAPGTYPIQGPDTDLNDCGLCALIFGDLATNGSTSMVLVAQNGTITIDAIELELGASFRGSVEQIEYRQVNTGGVIEGGCGLTVSNINFDVTLDSP